MKKALIEDLGSKRGKLKMGRQRGSISLKRRKQGTLKLLGGENGREMRLNFERSTALHMERMEQEAAL